MNCYDKGSQPLKDIIKKWIVHFLLFFDPGHLSVVSVLMQCMSIYANYPSNFCVHHTGRCARDCTFPHHDATLVPVFRLPTRKMKHLSQDRQFFKF